MKLIILSISYITLFTNSCYPQIYSLEECFSLAVKNNIVLKKNKNYLQSNYLDKKGAAFSLLPSLNINSEHLFSAGKNIDPVTNTFIKDQFSGGEVDMTLQLNIFSGFNAIRSIKANAYKLKASSYAYENSALEIFSAVAMAYSKAMFAREQIATIKDNNSNSKNELDIIEEKINVGKLSKSDYYTVNSRYKSEQADLIEAQNDYLDAIAELKYQIGLNVESSVGINNIGQKEMDSLLNKRFVPEIILSEILNTHPVLLETKLNEKLAETNLKMAKGNSYPNISLTGNLFSNYNLSKQNSNGSHISFNQQLNNNFGKTIGLFVQIPLFTKLQNHFAIEKEKINVTNARLSTLQTEAGLVKNIKSLINNFIAARQKYLLQSESLQQGGLSYNAYEEKYKLGFISSLELITAKDQLRSVQIKATQAKYDLYFKYKLVSLLINMPALD